MLSSSTPLAEVTPKTPTADTASSKHATQRMIPPEALALRIERGTALLREGQQFIAKAGNVTFFGMPVTKQKSANFCEVKSEILQEMGLSPDTRVAQVIGDSFTYNQYGTEFSRNILDSYLKTEQFMVVYGFTGHHDEKTCDINQLVNEWVDADPERARRTMANVVNFHSVKALREWGCDGSQTVANYYIVYGADNTEEKGAKFGDDVMSSDFITDTALCIDGGIQSFRQCTNFLYQNKPVTFVTGARGSDNVNTRAIDSNGSKLFTHPQHDEISENIDGAQPLYIPYFSAAAFFFHVKNIVNSRPDHVFSKGEMKIIWDNYSERHPPANPRRPDYSTKKKLLDEAWSQFLQSRIWEKLHLCTFYNCNDEPMACLQGKEKGSG